MLFQRISEFRCERLDTKLQRTSAGGTDIFLILVPDHENTCGQGALKTASRRYQRFYWNYSETIRFDPAISVRIQT
jgi:hypothetical protein